jgi:hypothetical protein
MNSPRLQVISISLAEVVLLLFFILLLLLADMERKYDRERSLAAEKLQTVQNVADQARRQVAAMRNAVTRAGSAGDPAAALASMADSSALPRAARTKFKTMAQQARADRKKAADPSETARQLAACRSENRETSRENNRLSELAARTEHERRLAEKTAKDATGINRELAAKLSECSSGEGYPPCWRGDDGKIQYMFDVYLADNGITVKRAWPGERDGDMTRFPEAEKLAGRTVRLEEFLDATAAVFAWSDQHVCRHFIRTYGDKSAMNATMFTEYHGVQNHFYHLNEIR